MECSVHTPLAFVPTTVYYVRNPIAVGDGGQWP